MEKLFFGAVGGVVLAAIVIFPQTIARNDIAACAFVQKAQLSNAVGVAQYRVTFKGGKAVKFECIKPAAK